MTCNLAVTRIQPAEWPRLRSINASSLEGLTFSASRRSGETKPEAMRRLAEGLAAGLARSLERTAEACVVDVYVTLLKVVNPGPTRTHMLRRDKVWRLLESWGERVPEGERVEIEISQNEDEIEFAGAVRAPIRALPDAVAVSLFRGGDSVVVVRASSVDSLESHLADQVSRRRRLGSLFVGAVSEEGDQVVVLAGESRDHERVELDVISRDATIVEALQITLM